MGKMNIKLAFLFVIIFILYPFIGSAGERQDIFIGNKKIQFHFNPSNGALLKYSNLTNFTEILNEKSVEGISFWEIIFEKNLSENKLNLYSAKSFHFAQSNSNTLQMEWSNFPSGYNSSLKVIVEVTVDKEKSFSSWHISVKGINAIKLREVIFPQISGIKDLGNEELAVPAWMGELIKNPRGYGNPTINMGKVYSWDYPGMLSMQFLALYNKEKDNGLYFASDDTLNYSKKFSIVVTKDKGLTYQINNYPSYDTINTEYVLPYKATIGTYEGDWYAAAKIYREWAVNQRWCKESRFVQDSNKIWINKTALWVWNRGESGNVLLPAEHLKKKLNLPVNVLWHWWHGCAYDDGFPEYFPPRQGSESFKQALSKANKAGINSLLYMNSFEWGTSTKSFTEEHASRWAVRNIKGEMEPHVFNIFTGHSLTPMCMATSFWRNKYFSLAERAINEYKVGGIYMDQACISYLCYDENHGHSIGGGNYWVKGFGVLTGKIRQNNSANTKTVLTGEGCGENWLPYLDAFLTLQVSKERYAGVGGTVTIPLFQAVYHQYGVTFGNYSSLVTPPFDKLWPKEDAPQNTEQLLDSTYSKQFLMEQARSFIWGMQPTIANYHSFLIQKRSKEIDYLFKLVKVRYNSLKYLLYGKFLRPPDIVVDSLTIPISKLSIYAGRKESRVTNFIERIPTLYTSAWKSNDGGIGIAFASIDNQPRQVKFNIDSNLYELGSRGKIFKITEDGKKYLTKYTQGKIQINFQLPAQGICLLEIVSTN